MIYDMQKKDFYVQPASEVVELLVEGVICDSETGDGEGTNWRNNGY